MKEFSSILEFVSHFDTEEKCREYLEQMRWGNTPACPFCASVNATRMGDGNIFQCNEKECRHQFSATVGTPMEHTKLPLRKWFMAIYIITSHTKSVSSLQLAKMIGVTQKTAWHMGHRIREMMGNEAPEKLDGIVECDETWIGGKLKNKHLRHRKNMGMNDNKTLVLGALSRNGNVATHILPDFTDDSITEGVRSMVFEGCVLISDEKGAYGKLNKDYSHAKVNHSKGEFKRGAAYTNTIEGFWNFLKKQLVGTHHYVSRKHLARYCLEASYKYNNRDVPHDIRFANALSNTSTALNYKSLIQN